MFISICLTVGYYVAFSVGLILYCWSKTTTRNPPYSVLSISL